MTTSNWRGYNQNFYPFLFSLRFSLSALSYTRYFSQKTCWSAFFRRNFQPSSIFNLSAWQFVRHVSILRKDDAGDLRQAGGHKGYTALPQA
ncbi:hypothetical protein [Microbulbifer mangrovi]|uniref:hypothetical protein n=1 Tax=Microbulbifer mangrovi TaxID=927787 RepID=UPI00117CBE18|nr:hypothetical protein [Microbulbifer mangrovi]